MIGFYISESLSDKSLDSNQSMGCQLRTELVVFVQCHNGKSQPDTVAPMPRYSSCKELHGIALAKSIYRILNYA